jgi:putative spermidine/putrescine transport system permease protein
LSERPGRLAHLPLLWPAAMLLVFFVIPFGIMVAISFYHRVERGFYEPAVELTHYARFLTPFFIDALAFSLWVAALVAVIAVALAFPFTWCLTRLRRRAQVAWLVLLLAVLSLSEVIIGFAWSMLLSRSAGVSNVLALVELMEPTSWTPSFTAVVLGLVYLAFPYTVLVLYPSLARLDPELPEAARTLGASPLVTFLTVVIPSQRRAITAGLILVFVFTLGAYLIPQILGRPRHWTLSVLITDQAIFQVNIPFAAAMAVLLLVVSLLLVVVTLRLGRPRRVPA